MSNRKFMRAVAVTMAFAMVLAMAGCAGDSGDVTVPTGNPSVLHTIQVTNRAGTGIGKCSVEVYSNADRTTQVFKGIANADGQIVFYAPHSDDYVAVISKLPTGYRTEEQYKLTGESTQVIVQPAVMDEAFIQDLIGNDSENGDYFKIGDAMPDFELTLPDYSVITLSQLLEEKKAVILNFWFMNCQPCKMEFPYLQEVYEQLSDDIALLAMNPVDSTPEEITQFQANHGYTFTMSKCDTRWQEMLRIQGYPTTVIIDRYGNICLIHSRGIESTQEFLDMVNYFIQDDYEQAFFKSPGQIPVVTD